MNMTPDASHDRQEITKTTTLSAPRDATAGFGRQPSEYTKSKERGEQLPLHPPASFHQSK